MWPQDSHVVAEPLTDDYTDGSSYLDTINSIQKSGMCMLVYRKLDFVDIVSTTEIILNTPRQW